MNDAFLGARRRWAHVRTLDLPEGYVFRHIADLPEAVTAEIMKVSVGAVKRYASEGRQALRELLAEFRPQRGGNDR